MNPLLFADWGRMNRLFTRVMWVVVVVMLRLVCVALAAPAPRSPATPGTHPPAPAAAAAAARASSGADGRAAGHRAVRPERGRPMSRDATERRVGHESGERGQVGDGAADAYPPAVPRRRGPTG